MSTNGLGSHWITLERQARMVAYICCKARSPKVKIKELRQSEWIRDALLDGCDIDEKTGQVDWTKGVVNLGNEEDFRQFVRMVNRHIEDEGVEFDLGKGALELITIIQSKEAELSALTSTGPAPTE